jgi:Predicted exonuclease
MKSVECQLGIDRDSVGIDGLEAVRLWWRYVDSFDLEALNILLKYNKEDVQNLKVLKEKLK